MFSTQHDLALMELHLSRRLSTLALRHNHFPVSAPDFSKSVVLEVCELSSFIRTSSNQPTRAVASPSSTPTVHLHCGLVGSVGSQSQEQLCIWLAELPYLRSLLILRGDLKSPSRSERLCRNVLASPDTVLPIVLSCQGRAYSPPTSPSDTADMVGSNASYNINIENT